MRNKYLDIHEDDGMRHSGLVPTREGREQERLYAELTCLLRKLEIAVLACVQIQNEGNVHSNSVATQALAEMEAVK